MHLHLLAAASNELTATLTHGGFLGQSAPRPGPDAVVDLLDASEASTQSVEFLVVKVTS